MSEEVYRHKELPGVVLRVSMERCMGDTDVDFAVEVRGDVAYRESDPNIEGMAFSRDGEWLFVQSTDPGFDTRYRTFAMPSGREVEGRLHPSDPATYIVASDFVRGTHRLGGVGDGRFRGGRFTPTHPMRFAAVAMTPGDRLHALEEVLARGPSAEGWDDLAGLFERWTGEGVQQGVERALVGLASWPELLRRRPAWLDWADAHPLWALVAAPETQVEMASRPLDVESLRRMLARPALAHLDILKLSACGIGDEGARVIAGSASLKYLRTLGLYRNPLTDAGARALGQSPWLSNLTSLSLLLCPVSPAVIAELRLSPNLPLVERLYGDGSAAGHMGVKPPKPGTARRVVGPSKTAAPLAVEERPYRPFTEHDCVPGLEEALEEGTFDEEDRWGRTMLFRAVAPFGGCIACTRRLIDAGADVNFRTAQGLSVLDELRGGVSSGIEHETANKIEAVLRAAGYRDTPSA